MQKTVRQFLRFSYLAGYLGCDLSALSPTVRSPRLGKVVRGIPLNSIEAVLAGIVGDAPADLRDRAILWLLSTYGVRGVQIRRLCLEDVAWTRSRIHFPAAKRGRSVEAPLTAKAGNRLAEYIHNGRPNSPHREVFLHTYEPFAPIRRACRLSEIIRRRIEKAGVELPEGVLYGAHAFRHALASRLYGRVPFKDVIDIMGHRKPSTTLIYGKADLTGLRKAALPWPGGVR
jgi:integrase